MRIISGKYGRRRFDVPKNITARPTTDFARENIFNVLGNMVDFDSGLSALDLFSGTGAVAWELVSRGCSPVVAVEKARTQAQFILQVKKLLGDESLTMIKGDVFRYLKEATQQFDLIFADPPYDLPEFDEVLPAILDSKTYREGTLLILEHSGKKDYSSVQGFTERRVYGSVNFSLFRL